MACGNLIREAGLKGYAITISQQRCGLWDVIGGLDTHALRCEVKDEVFLCSGRSDLSECLRVVIDGLDELKRLKGKD